TSKPWRPRMCFDQCRRWHNRIMKPLLLIAALAVLAAPGAGALTGQPPPCSGGDLTGAFRVVPGRAGAANIVYALQLRNTSIGTCFVTGIPGLVLLGKTGKALPTHARPSFPGALTAVMVRLAPGKTARTTARFSPDVPGVGEQVPGACE